MVDHEPNVYDNPEKFSLEIIARIDYPTEMWMYDARVVWIHKLSQKLYTARDYFSECGIPFGNYTSLDTLEIVNPKVIEEEVRREIQKSGVWGCHSIMEAEEFLSKIKHALATSA